MTHNSTQLNPQFSSNSCESILLSLLYKVLYMYKLVHCTLHVHVYIHVCTTVPINRLVAGSADGERIVFIILQLVSIGRVLVTRLQDLTDLRLGKDEGEREEREGE